MRFYLFYTYTATVTPSIYGKYVRKDFSVDIRLTYSLSIVCISRGKKIFLGSMGGGGLQITCCLS